MQKAKIILSVFLVSALTFQLSACGNEAGQSDAANHTTSDTASVVIAEPKAPGGTIPGYISTELETPDWIDALDRCDIIGDTMYFSVRTMAGGIAAASYDTISGEWRRYDLDTGDAHCPNINAVSAAGESLWVLLREGYSDEEKRQNNFTRDLDYYLLHMDLNTGSQTCHHVDFWSEGHPYLASFIALDNSRVLVGDTETVYVLNVDAEVTDKPGISIPGEGLHVRVNDTLYVYTENGLCSLDGSASGTGAPINGVDGPFVYGGNLGRIYVTENNVLYRVDPNSGERTEIFKWADVALSYSNLYGFMFGIRGFENSNGDIYHLSNKLTKISFGEVPVKKTLTLACLGPMSGEMSSLKDTPATGTTALLDAMIRFNNTDPEYRVELRPLLYQDDAERDRLLIEIATGNDIDLLDTSFLPEGTVDEGLLVDLMPYIDADNSISRDDFIPGLLDAMMKNGGLYEYTDKVTMITMLTHPDCMDEGVWTTETVKSLIDQHPEWRLPSGQEDLVTLFSWAATAEFMDWNDGTCHFDSTTFVSWLSLLKLLADNHSEWSQEPYLFTISSDLARGVGVRARHTLRDDYVIAGFPDAEGTGSYFMKLSTDETVGRETSLGIMASSINCDGAWRFVRTFMQGETEPLLFSGIPVFKESFEQALEDAVQRAQAERQEEGFHSADAAHLREIVYNTDKIVCLDQAVLNTLESIINAYLGGKESAEEATRQIQSRMSIYMAEHS